MVVASHLSWFSLNCYRVDSVMNPCVLYAREQAGSFIEVVPHLREDLESYCKSEYLRCKAEWKDQELPLEDRRSYWSQGYVARILAYRFAKPNESPERAVVA